MIERSLPGRRNTSLHTSGLCWESFAITVTTALHSQVLSARVAHSQVPFSVMCN